MHSLVFTLSPTDSGHPDLLEPYDENLEVEPYSDDCICLGSQARSEAHTAAKPITDRLVAEREEIRDQLRDLAAAIQESLSPEQKEQAKGMWLDSYRSLEDLTADQQALLNRLSELETKSKDLVGQMNRVVEAHRVAHPLLDRPDPECQECRGSGQIMANWNPKGRWDYWSVGGRWTGHLDPDYDPAKDERNWSECTLCDESGHRYWLDDGQGGLKSVDPGTPGATKKQCNACQGTKRVGAFHLAPHPAGDQMKAAQVADLLEREEVGLPRALVSADGWNESDDPPFSATVDTKWKEKVIGALRDNPEHYVTVIDIHS